MENKFRLFYWQTYYIGTYTEPGEYIQHLDLINTVPRDTGVVHITNRQFSHIKHRGGSKSFIYQQVHFVSALQIIKIYIKTYIKTAPTCFGLRPSSGSLQSSLATVTCDFS